MCEKCEELREKCFILFPLADRGNRTDLEAKIGGINEILNSMGFSLIEKQGLKYCLNNSKF